MKNNVSVYLSSDNTESLTGLYKTYMENKNQSFSEIIYETYVNSIIRVPDSSTLNMILVLTIIPAMAGIGTDVIYLSLYANYTYYTALNC